MASAEKERKRGHLEAGKRRLEEFRKKKAEAKAKKAAAGGQSQSDGISQYDKLSIEDERRDMGSADVVKDLEPLPSNDLSDFRNTSSVQDSLTTAIDFHNTGLSNVYNDSNHLSSYADHGRDSIGQHPSESKEVLHTDRLENGYYDRYEDVNIREVIKNTVNDTQEALDVKPKLPPDLMRGYADLAENSRNPGSYSLHDQRLEEIGNSSLDSLKQGYGSSAHFAAGSHDMYSNGILHLDVDNASHLVDKAPTTSYGDMPRLASNSADGAVIFSDQYVGDEAKRNYASGWLSDAREKKQQSSDSDYQPNLESAPWRNSRSFFPGSNVNARSSFTQGTTLASEIEARRSRPSFPNSNSVPSPSWQFGLYRETEKDDRLTGIENSKMFNDNFPSLAPAKLENGVVEPFPDNLNAEEIPMNTFSSNREDNFPLNFDLHVANKDEDFAALEQHIEDLTQEKFSLQRTLESSRALAESLAAENSSLTDSFNQQGTVVNQLKSHMEKLQEEIKSQLAAIEALKMEYTNAQLECNAADERAKILASEVISLEEKALRLRSNELKLEREMENASAEVGSYKRKLSNLEKERSELLATVDALREEKKLLHYKIRNASSSEGVVDKSKSSIVTKDISTSTADLDVEIPNQTSNNLDPSFRPVIDAGLSSVQSGSISSVPLLLESAESHLADASSSIPPDQLRTINNIDSLLSELALEKEELLRALTLESSKCSEYKALNKDLSQKLEVQTQRLELLTAQNMASANILVKSADFNSLQDESPYPDEGDEVVERVLGWIMKLFPGGPAKRRTSKLL